MTLHRVVCLSRKDPAASPHEVLTACHDFPSRNAQSGIAGKLVAFGEQYVLLLEGGRREVERLVKRIQRRAPEFGFTVRSRQQSDDRAFCSWAIGDVYRDEIERATPDAAEVLDDLLIDLLAEASDDAEQSFADLAAIVEGVTPAIRRPLAAAA